MRVSNLTIIISITILISLSWGIEVKKGIWTEIKSEYATIREKASPASTALLRAQKGDSIQILERSESYLRVSYEGVEGYLHYIHVKGGESLLKDSSIRDKQESEFGELPQNSIRMKVKSSEATLRDTPTFSGSKVLMKIPQSKVVHVIDEVGDFYHVWYRGISGYMYQYSLEYSTDSRHEIPQNVPDRLKIKDQKTYTIVGFTANLPMEYFGLCIAGSRPEKIGLYLDLKTSISFKSGGDDFYENISVNKAENIFGDNLIDTSDSWTSFNAAGTKRISGQVTIYLGLGVSLYRKYRQYKDEFEILGDHGEYWIEDESESKTTLNTLGGIFIVPSESKITIQFGVEGQPAGFTAGIGGKL